MDVCVPRNEKGLWLENELIYQSRLFLSSYSLAFSKIYTMNIQ